MPPKRSKSEERERKRLYRQNRTNDQKKIEMENDKKRKAESRKMQTDDKKENNEK